MPSDEREVKPEVHAACSRRTETAAMARRPSKQAKWRGLAVPGASSTVSSGGADERTGVPGGANSVS